MLHVTSKVLYNLEQIFNYHKINDNFLYLHVISDFRLDKELNYTYAYALTNLHAYIFKEIMVAFSIPKICKLYYFERN